MGARTLFYCDDLDRKVAQIDPTGAVVQYFYDAAGNLKQTRAFDTLITLPVTPGGTAPLPGGTARDTYYDYDNLNRLTSSYTDAGRTGYWNGSAFVTQSGSAFTYYEYDAAGNVIKTTDPNGNTVFSYYDRLGRKTHEVDRENFLTKWEYDAEGNALTERRYATQASTPTTSAPPVIGETGADRITTFSYDKLGRRLTETRHGVDAWSIDAGTGALSSASGNATITYTYNALGQVLTKTEANGDTTTYEYDSAGRLTRETRAGYHDQDGAWVAPDLRYFYNGLDQLTATRQTGNGSTVSDRVTGSSYEDGRLRFTTDANGHTRYYHYDAAGRLVAESYARMLSAGYSVTEAIFYVHDAAGRVIAQTHARHDGSGWVHSDADGQAYEATRMRYNAHGELTGRGITAGHTAAAVYQEYYDHDAAGRVLRSNAGDGVAKYFAYDKAGNQTLALVSEGSVDLTAINYADLIDSIAGNPDTNFAGISATITVHDRRGMVKETREPGRQLSIGGSEVTLIRSRTYNAFGEVMSETDARGYTTSFAYNTMGRLLTKVSPQVSVTGESGAVSSVNPTEHYRYDIAGRLIGSIDANGNLTSRLLLAGTGHGGGEALTAREFHADGGVLRTFYDRFGDARILRNELGQDEAYSYDAMGRVTAVTRRGGQLTEYFAHDGLGQRIWQWNSFQGSSAKALTDYDIQGRIVSSVAIGGETTTTGYVWNAGLGGIGGWTQTASTNADRVSGGDGIHAAVRNADMFGRVISRTDKGGQAFSYQYDHAGQMVTETSNSGRNMAYSYYNTGQIRQVFTGDAEVTNTDWSNKIASYEYDALGRLTREMLVSSFAEYTEERTVWVRGPGTSPDTPDGEGYGWYETIPESYDVQRQTLQDGRAEYDAAGRIVRYRDVPGPGYGSVDYVDKRWTYDAVGNVRSIATDYREMAASGAISSTATLQTYWYRYDSMNRLVTTKGTFSGAAGSGTISRGAVGTDITYNVAGQRATAQTGWNAQEDYSYNAAGLLTTVMNGSVLRAVTTYDALNRVTGYSEHDVWGTAVHSRHSIDYDLRGQVLSEKTSTRQGSDTVQTHTVNHYSADGTGATQPVITYSSQTGSSTGSLLYFSRTKNWMDGGSSPVYGGSQDNAFVDSDKRQTYIWLDAAVQKNVILTNRHGSSSSTYNYDRDGMLASVDVSGDPSGTARAHHISYTNNLKGQILRRSEFDWNFNQNDPQTRTYMFGGRQMGTIGNDGTGNVDYAASIAERTAAPGSGPFRNGATSGAIHADFDANFTALNGSTVSEGPSGYTTNAGETLQSIAAQLWGDSSLWYKLAEANPGLAAGAIAAGTSLRIPGGVIGNHHSADTFKPYDPAEAIGNTSPNTPKPPKKNNCGVFGQILVAAVAIGLSIWLGPQMVAAAQGLLAGSATATVAAGSATAIGGGILGGAATGVISSVASQAFGMATGIQQGGFNWGAVAMAGIAGGIGGGFTGLSQGLDAGARITTQLKGGLGGFLSGGGFVSGAARSVISNVLTQGIGVATRLQSKFDFAGVAAAAAGGGLSSEIGGGRVLSAATDGLASAAARSLVTGTSFGDNIIAVLPDVIGRTIGGMVAGRIAGTRDTSGAPPQSVPTVADADVSMLDAGSTPISDVLGSPLPSLGGSGTNQSAGSADDGEIVVTATKKALAEARASSGSARLSFMGPVPGTAPFTVAPYVASTSAAPSSAGVTPRDIARLLGRRALGAASLLLPTNSDLDLSIPLNGTDFTIGGKAAMTSRYLLDKAGNGIGSLEIIETGSLYRVLGADGTPGMFADYTGIGGANAIVVTMGADGSQRGFGISVQDQAEWDIAREAQVRGLDAYQIQDAINAYRGGNDFRLAELRGFPGTAFNSGTLGNIDSGWLITGSGAVPEQVAAQLRGREFDNFDAFREEFWKTAAGIPELAAGFSPQSLGRMKAGNAPYTLPGDRVGKQATFQIHHVQQIQHGGAVYDMSNMLIMTPRAHHEWHRNNR